MPSGFGKLLGKVRTKGELILTEVAAGVTVEDVKSKTDAQFHVASDLKTFE